MYSSPETPGTSLVQSGFFPIKSSNRTRQIVIYQPGEYPAEKGKSMNMPIEEGLLLLTRIGSNKWLA